MSTKEWTNVSINDMQTCNESWKEVSMQRLVSNAREHKYSKAMKSIEVGKVRHGNTNY